MSTACASFPTRLSSLGTTIDRVTAEAERPRSASPTLIEPHGARHPYEMLTGASQTAQGRNVSLVVMSSAPTTTPARRDARVSRSISRAMTMRWISFVPS